MSAINDQRDAVEPTTGRIAALAGRLDAGEPHPTRGPFTRWPRATDAVVAVIVFAASLVFVAVSELDDGDTFETSSIGDLPAGAFALLAVAAAALWWRRTRPVAVTVFVLAVMIVWALAGYGDGHDLALVVSTYSVGRYCTDHRFSLASVVAAFSVSVIGSFIDTNQLIDVWPAVVFTALPWYVGLRVRNRGAYVALLQERAERLEAEQLAREREAVAAERSRIARELHDVVAHQVSMMTVQAGAARTIAPHDVDTAVEAMSDVERAGRAALGELRHLLGVLRHDTTDATNTTDATYVASFAGIADIAGSDQLRPPPGLDGIPTLADELAHTGADVTIAVAELPDRVSTALHLSAYRIVQESFTNIVKHAGPEPVVHVSITVEGPILVIDITNTVRRPKTTVTTPSATTRLTAGGSVAPDLPASGYGIAGMRERATLLGGTLTTGPQQPGSYRVHARLPLEPDAA